MCGRTACTLDNCKIQRATRQYSRDKDDLPWIQKYAWQSYQPSYNFAPSQVSPVITNGDLVYLEEKSDNYILTPMRWGFIPSWYKGTIEECSFKNNNCRLEGLLEKPTFRGAAMAGRRCIVLADGFYEWKDVGNKKKQPYFIYFPQEKGPEIFTQDVHFDSDEEVYTGQRLLTMAGIFDVWRNPQKEELYSYSIITLDASKTFSTIHHRMPAILSGPDEISMWLDFNRVPTKEALSILKPVDDLQMHPVSTLVSYCRNNSIDCLKPLKESEKNGKDLKATGLTSWLLKGKSQGPPSKRSKLDS